MKLFYANTSPYARKVRVVAAEKGLDGRIEAILCNPFDESPELKAVNPLGKVPSLLLDNGDVLYDSPAICEYLDSLAADSRLIPEEGSSRWVVLRRHALADGILDAAFAIVMERRRPEGEQSPSWMERWAAAIGRSLDAVETEIGSFPAKPDLAHIAVACALAYLDFRLPDLEWRNARPATEKWFDKFAERPSMKDTRPEG